MTCTDNWRKLVFISGGGAGVGSDLIPHFSDLQNMHKLSILHWLIPSFNAVFHKCT